MVFFLRLLLILSLAALNLAYAAEDRNLGVNRAAAGDKRIALIIGNAAYSGAPLANPVNDAKDMAATLRKLGFEVIEKTNATQKDMNLAIVQFGGKLRADTVALFYYAGHGMQVKGKNYLIPIDAQINSEATVRAMAVDVDTVMDQLAVSPLNIVILDACRNNPFERRFRSVGGGLAQMDAPKGSLIAYATAPGKVANDGTGRNGLYTQELLKHIQTPGLPLEAVFKRVRNGVMQGSGEAQTPWEASSLTGDFFFRPGQDIQAASAKPELVSPPLRVQSSEEIEQELWNKIKGGNDPTDFEDYLRQYPSGRFVALANAELKRLNRKQEATRPHGETTLARSDDQDDEGLLKTLLKEGTPEALDKYLSMHPRSRYVDGIRKEIATLERIRNFKFAELPLDLAIKTVHGSGKWKIASFEDPNCSFCKELNKEFAKMSDVTIFTFLFSFLGTDSIDKTRAIWCSPEPSEALRNWMVNNIAPASQEKCDASGIDRIQHLAREQLRLKAAPIIFFPNGNRIDGFVKADAIKRKMME